MTEWSKLAAGIRVVQTAGNHGSMITEPYVKELADKLSHAIRITEKQTS